MITKFDVGDTVEIIAHPEESLENLAMNPWVIKRIEITEEGVSYTMNSLVNKTATILRCPEDGIQETHIHLLTKCPNCLNKKACNSGCPDCFHPSGMLDYCHNDGHKTEESEEWGTLEQKFPHLLNALKALRDKPPISINDNEWLERLAKDLSKFKD